MPIDTEKTTIALANLFDFKASNGNLPDPFEGLGLDTRMDFFQDDEDEQDERKWWLTGTEFDVNKKDVLGLDFTNPKRSARSIAKIDEAGVPGALAAQVIGEQTPVQGAFNPDRWIHKHDNGRIPLEDMVKIGPDDYLRQDAAAAWKAMVKAARKDGVDLVLTGGDASAYRDYETQVRLKAEKPTLAATPGKSNHGWGIAVDVATGREWIAANGDEFGWHQLPTEDWHFDFKGDWDGAYQTKAKDLAKPKKKGPRKIRASDLDDISPAEEYNATTVFPFAIAETMTKTKAPDDSPRAARPDVGKHMSFVPQNLRKFFEIAARKTGIDMRLLEIQARHESGFAKDVIRGDRKSSAGAIGVMQLMPGTAEGLGVDPYNVRQNIIGGARYLAQQLNTFGNIRDALAAYNGGPGNVNTTETQGYADRIISEWKNL